MRDSGRISRAVSRPQPGPGIRLLGLLAATSTAYLALVTGTQDANANGETRSLQMVHAHTGEAISITYKRNGGFDSGALEKLNWFLRDWRIDEPISMSPDLFDVIWYVYREVGANDPIKVMSAYRSPGTNAMLRRRSRAVAKESQHMRGNAMDIHIPGVSMARAREIGMRLQRGGVGYYPSAGSPFVHLDVGSVRSWPRMPREQLERLFPDGKTVHIPSDGVPLANYEAAYAEIQSRGGSALDYATVNANRGKSLWALLFGGDEDEDRAETARGSSRVAARNPRGRQSAPPQVAFANPDNVMAVAPQAASAPPQRVAAVTLPAAPAEPAAPLTRSLAGTIQPAPATQPLPMVNLPFPPVRPRGVRFAALVAAAEPLPPARPAGLMAPAGVSAAPVMVAGLPAPPTRPAAVLPAIVSRPEPPSPGGLVQSYATIAAPVPPNRPQAAAAAGASRSLAAAVQPAAAPRQAGPGASRSLAAAVRTPGPNSGPVYAPRPVGPAALIGLKPMTEDRPAGVLPVIEPPVAREVRQAVTATRFSLQVAATVPVQGFSGGFIRPLGASFTRPGE